MNVHSHSIDGLHVVKLNSMTLGQRLRAIRQRARWTLKEMSQRSEIPVSTLSKVERDTLTLSYPQLARLIENLHLRAADLFEHDSASAPITGWRSIQRGEALTYQAVGAYECGYACAELRHKKMRPVLVRLRGIETTKHDWQGRGDGDEYLFVLEGSIEVNTELYAPVVLNEGDSIYLDSRIKHSYAAAQISGTATALIVCCEQSSLPLQESVQ
jgi:transcriptional regulator with XRE-family HTH domain